MWPSGQVTHYNIPTGQVTHYNVTIWVGNPLQYTNWAGNPLQCDHFWKIIVFFSNIGQVAWNNETTCEILRILLSSGRLPKTVSSIKKKTKNKKQKTKNKQKQTKTKKNGSSFEWFVSWFQHLSVKVICQSPVFKVFKKKKSKSSVCIYFSL